jgi:hypothetical protein
MELIFAHNGKYYLGHIPNTLFYSCLMNDPNKLERLFQTGLYPLSCVSGEREMSLPKS